MCNSTPVKKAEKVEADNHTDLIELRLDHLAGGATILFFIGALCLIYLFCRRRRQQPAQPPAFPMMPLQPPFPPQTFPMMPFQPPVHSPGTVAMPITWHVRSDDLSGFAEALTTFARRDGHRRIQASRLADASDLADVEDVDDDPTDNGSTSADRIKNPARTTNDRLARLKARANL